MSALEVVSSESVEWAWRAFVEAPARCVAMPWLRDCLGDVADDAALISLAHHPRFQQRLARRLIDRHGLTPPEALTMPRDEDALLLALPAEAGATLARYCGVICHAVDFVREIRAPRVMVLKQRFGEAAFAAALANRELAVVQHPSADIDALDREVRRDGQACIAAWLERQPSGVAAWLALGLADGLSPEMHDAIPAVHQQGPNVVRRAATIVAAEIRETEHARTADPSGQDRPAQR